MTTPRRGFLKSLALAPLAPSALAAQVAPQAAPSTDQAVAEALTEAVRREFGPHLEAAELDAVKREIAHDLESARHLRHAAGLLNADEPATRFEARAPAAAVKGSRQ